MDATRIGDWTLTSLDDGGFRLDGGAMYGIVPRALWERYSPPDAANRIAMRARPLLARGPAGTVLIEAGLGDAGDDVFTERFAVDRPRGLVAALRGAGVAPEAVDHVVLSHIHWDHAGGLVSRAGDALVPTFPNARHHIQRGTWEAAFDRAGPRAASYHPERLEPIADADRLSLVDGDGEVLPGIELRLAGGHCEAHAVVLVRSAGQTAAFLGDLVPLASHMRPLWVMGYDMWPMQTIADRRALLEEAERERWLLALYHDPEHAFGRVGRDKRGEFAFVPEA